MAHRACRKFPKITNHLIFYELRSKGLITDFWSATCLLAYKSPPNVFLNFFRPFKIFVGMTFSGKTRLPFFGLQAGQRKVGCRQPGAA
ncbi:MAG: hypothetical protein H9789_00140, partial [Candidatus Paraprevotella stercoravium]|nr:hypothetical protein [Candidatus Paraprevotella stercoravium]